MTPSRYVRFQPRTRLPRPYTPREFRGAWWLPGPHSQTLAGHFLRRSEGVCYRRERLDTADGDFLDLDFAVVNNSSLWSSDAPVALLLHGLEGSSRSPYVRATCRTLAERGIRAVVMNYRSCSGEMNRLPRFYHGGETADLAWVLAHLAGRFAGVPIVGIGFSLGASILLNYLGAEGERAGFRAAVAVSVPFDLGEGERKLYRSPMGRVYMRLLLRSLAEKYALKRDVLGALCDEDAVLAARRFREFDTALTAPLHGFRDAEDYYLRASCAPALGCVRVPTLLIHAMNDPFVAEETIPAAAIHENPFVFGAVVEEGGHVGFIAGGTPLRPVFWGEEETARFLAVQLGIDEHAYPSTLGAAGTTPAGTTAAAEGGG